MTKKLFFTVGLLVSGAVFSQSSFWKQINSVDSKAAKFETKADPSSFKLYQLNVEAFKDALKNAPQRLSGNESLVLNFPTTEGKMEAYVVQEAPVFSPGLQEKYPEIRSYVGYQKGNNLKSIRFSVSPYDGVHIMYFKPGVTSYLDTYTTDKNTYILYDRSALSADPEGFVCGYKGPDISDYELEGESNLVQDGFLRTYRLALTSTVEYSNYHINRVGMSGGTTEEKIAAVLAAMNTTMTRVNGVFEITVSLTMQLIPNNNLLVSIGTDSFTNNDGYTLLDENQAFVDSVIGDANYDIGHIFSTGGGGVAQLRSPCVSGSKARGVTGSSAPIGDAYDIDYVAHEMGHQYGATHTFDNSCSSNRTTSTAVEPGSGSTIMSYAGICPPNIQTHSDDYFHTVSVNQMYSNISTGQSSSCPVKTSNGNTVPVAYAGADHYIPYGTAFVLTGEGSDPDGDAVTYLWEQTDIRSTTTSTSPSQTQTNGAVFRSFEPSESNQRYLPSLNYIVANNLNPTWEVIPQVERVLRFALLVNDNRITGNQAARDNVVIFVSDAGPFKVTSHTSNTTYTGNTETTVTWNVAGTDASPVSTENVKISLSDDNGYTFPYVLAESVPNSGSASVILPNINTTNARIKVEAVNNIYFAYNSSKFKITENLAVDDVAKKAFSLYPNPAKGEVNIILQNTSKAVYQIFDASGRLVKTGDLASRTNLLSVSDLSAGVYRVVVNADGKVHSESLIVK